VEEKTCSRKVWVAFLLLVGAALAGSLWAWRAPWICGACQGVSDLGRELHLAPIGVTYYAVILGACLVLGPNRFSFAGVSLAAAVHAVLLVLLVHRSVFCGPCFLTGLSALGAMGTSFFIDPLNLGRASLLLPIGATASHAAIFALGLVTAAPLAVPVASVPGPSSEESVPKEPGTAQMVIYFRPGCSYCEELDRDVLPTLCEEFGPRLRVVRRPAPAGLPSPTIVITGAARTVFPGLPSRTVLREAIQKALGGKTDVASMLPEPR
jgi:hypothetical protein